MENAKVFNKTECKKVINMFKSRCNKTGVSASDLEMLHIMLTRDTKILVSDFEDYDIEVDDTIDLDGEELPIYTLEMDGIKCCLDPMSLKMKKVFANSISEVNGIANGEVISDTVIIAPHFKRSGIYDKFSDNEDEDDESAFSSLKNLLSRVPKHALVLYILKKLITLAAFVIAILHLIGVVMFPMYVTIPAAIVLVLSLIL